MDIRDVDGVCIADITGNVVSQSELKELKKLYKTKAGRKRIGINLENVCSINYDFILLLQECAFKQKISLFNVAVDVYMMLFISHSDKYINIYLDENDFISDKRSIVYRRLKLLKSA